MPDIHLSADHLEGLDSLEAVQALFARFGYTQHAPVDPATFTSPAVRADLLQVDQCWRDSFHRVLLCVYPTVTQQRVNALAAEFRDVGGRQLVVLAAADFRRLDFVLFDRTPAGLVPRRLVVRRGLDQTPRQAVLLRALRRFTYTEPDPLAQWEKLRSAFTSAEWSEQYFDNRGLFSDYYLAGPLREMPEWTDAAAQAGDLRALHATMTAVRADLLDARAPAPDTPVAPDAALLERTLFAPLAAQLGYRVEPVAPTSPDARQPDYTLWHPAADHPLAIALVYGWDRPLDGPAPYDPADDPRAAENPGAAVVSALANYTYHDAAGTAHPVPWAIVTNGKHWRLYSTLAASQATDFLQLDLEEAIAATTPTGQPDPTILHYFALLFGARSLLPGVAAAAGDEPPRPFLARLVALGRTYAQELGDRLKDRIFADIFRLLAEGFIADQTAADAPAPTPAQLRTVFDGTLTLLYRLLFLLYAESRNLLPSQEAGAYWDASLERLKSEVAAAAGTDAAARDARLGRAYAADGHTLWTRLRALFTTVDRGSAEYNVPAYNGGLFAADGSPGLSAREQEVAAFLDRWRVDDLRLAQALDRLARDPNPKSRTQALEPIDFRSLGVRQLGSIYEGLLEFQLQIAPERLAITTKDTYVPLAVALRDKVKIRKQGGSDAPRDWAVEAGAPYVTNSTLERKASGSYYTPEAIVEYIVEHTIGPGLKAHLASLDEDLRRARAGGPPRAVDAPLTAQEQRLVERIFEFRVLDPAMGSGHFLVAAVDFIADRLIDFLNGYPHNPVERMLAATRAAIIASAEAGGVTIDPARLSAINLLKRHVLKACLYGVDLNPMAVELAKVSLWLHCFTLGAPLSFLGHHLKVGNSLVGETELGDVLQEGSARWAELEQAIGEYLSVSRQPDATSAEVADSRQTFTRAEAKLAALRARANAQTGRHFLGLSGEEVGQLQQIAEGRDRPTYKRRYDELQALAQDRAFFHWPLEFPEVYFEPTTIGHYHQRANPGFEAVVGNPPWGQKAHAVSERERQYFKAAYQSLRGIFDLFRPFIERSVHLSGHNGRYGAVLPDILLLKDYPSTRLFLLDSLALERLDWWGDIFADAVIDAVTLVGRRNSDADEVRCEVHGPAPRAAHNVSLRHFRAAPAHTFNLHLTAADYELLAELANLPTLGEYFEAHEGVHSGNIRAELFVPTRLDDTCEPLLFGRDELRPYRLAWNGQYIRLSAVPTVRGKRYANIGQRRWHKQDKVLVRRTGDYVLAAVDLQHRYASNNFFIVIPSKYCSLDLHGLCAFLNSEFITWYFRWTVPREARAFAELKIRNLSTFPLPPGVAEEGACARLNALGAARAEQDGSCQSVVSALEQEINEEVERLIGIQRPGQTALPGD